MERESPALLRWPRTALLLLHCSIRLARARKCWSRPPRREATLPAIRHLLPASRHAHHFFAATSFITSISRSRSLPLSTPPGATSRILPGPIIAAGFAPASVGVHRIEVAYYISSGNAGECAFAQICLKLGACWDKQVANITYGVVLLRIVLNSCLNPASAASNTAELGMRGTSRRLATS